ncbi:MAG: hypothetical protein ABI679_12820 [Gemmatimonadota bacterium]
MKRLVIVLAMVACIVSPALAQQPVTSPGSPMLIKYGKWVLLAGSITMNIAARQAHEKADDAFRQITDACLEDRSRCSTTSNGRYVDPFLEAQFQQTLKHDSAARRWLIGGQTALVGAAMGFIWELARSKSHPSNIPFEPDVSQRNGNTQVGVRFSF